MELQENELFANRYRLLKEQGRGSFGEVWLAQDEQLDNMQVAIKIYIALDDRGVEEFKKEFKTAYKLNHPNLLHAHYFDVCEKRPFLVMPYCPESAISLVGNCDRETLWQFIRDVASGLAFLHSRDIVHHDIKPDNILRTEDGGFVITDFGISTRMRSTLRRNSTRIMDHNPSGGSLPYMGPEMFSGRPESIKATDIWAFGVTIYELITGELPFFGQGGVMQMNGAAIPELAYEDPEIVELVYACMARDPWDRPLAEDIVEISKRRKYKAKPDVRAGSHERVEDTRPIPSVRNDDGNAESLVIESPLPNSQHSNQDKKIGVLTIAKVAIILFLSFHVALIALVMIETCDYYRDGFMLIIASIAFLSSTGLILMLKRPKKVFYLSYVLLAICSITGFIYSSSSSYHVLYCELYSDMAFIWILDSVIILLFAVAITGILKIKSRKTGLSSWDIMGYDEVYEPAYGLYRVKKGGKFGMIDKNKNVVIPIEQDSLSPIMHCHGPEGIPGPGLRENTSLRYKATVILGCIFEKGDEKGIYRCDIHTGGTAMVLIVKMSKSEWAALSHLT